jgi:hypothetical protein
MCRKQFSIKCFLSLFYRNFLPNNFRVYSYDDAGIMKPLKEQLPVCFLLSVLPLWYDFLWWIVQGPHVHGVQRVGIRFLVWYELNHFLLMMCNFTLSNRWLPHQVGFVSWWRTCMCLCACGTWSEKPWLELWKLNLGKKRRIQSVLWSVLQGPNKCA